MSDTPRTDAATGKAYEWTGDSLVCNVTVAQTLERELSAAIARAEAAERELTAHKRLNKDLENESVKAYAERDEARAELARLTMLAQGVVDARMDFPTALAYAVLEMKAALPIPTPKEAT